MEQRYDLVVIGAGSAGIVASLTAAGLGARVALAEAGRLGGECLNTGCIPSKSLIASARLVQEMRTADRLGLEPVQPELDFARVMERVQTVIGEVGERDSAAYLAARGVEVVLGRARFEAPGRIEVDGRRLRYRAALIAAGSRPARPDVPGIDQVEYLTTDTLFDLREQPQRLLILGGGAVGTELGQAFARLGSRVDIVEAQGSLLPGEDPEVGVFLTRRLESEGVTVHLRRSPLRIEPSSNGNGRMLLESRTIDYDQLLVAARREPATEGLGLDNVGVETGPAGEVRVNSRLRTTGSHIYAAGDVVGGLQFTHVAGYHGLVAVANALFRARRNVDRAAVPRVVFSDPEAACVGLTEAAARERLGRDPLVLRHDYAESDRALTASEASGFAKLVADRRGRLLGASIVAPAAGESLAEVARLIEDGRRVADLSQMIHAYPTFTEGPARAADEWWRLRYFTPRAHRFTRPLLALLRAVDRPRGG
jgi:pyruvate/2-oxoglutarate dehydrogenase complex dihydrolipoamide dehydrogenase (E3) component